MKQHLEEAIKAAQAASTSLQAALRGANTVQGILILDIIEKARDLETRATSLFYAVKADCGKDG